MKIESTRDKRRPWAIDFAVNCRVLVMELAEGVGCRRCLPVIASVF
jgi:hypothetical protein